MKKYNCILLVDDDETCNFITEKIITKLKVSDNTYSMKNGQEALTFIKEKCDGSDSCSTLCPDLILLDLNMPVMDGLEFLEQFYTGDELSTKCSSGIDIYVLSSSDNTEDKEKANKYNVKGYITKPMTADKLMHISGN